MQRGTAGDKHFEPGAGAEQFGDQRCGRGYLLKVIQQEQALLVAQRRFQEFLWRLSWGLAQLQCLRDGCRDQASIAERSQRHKPDAIVKAVEQIFGNLQSQAGLADATGANEREQAHLLAFQKQGCPCHLRFTSNEGSERGWYMVGWMHLRLPGIRERCRAGRCSKKGTFAWREPERLDKQV